MQREILGSCVDKTRIGAQAASRVHHAIGVVVGVAPDKIESADYCSFATDAIRIAGTDIVESAAIVDARHEVDAPRTAVKYSVVVDMNKLPARLDAGNARSGNRVPQKEIIFTVTSNTARTTIVHVTVHDHTTISQYIYTEICAIYDFEPVDDCMISGQSEKSG